MPIQDMGKQMMDRMLAGMSPGERTEFVLAMLPRCLDTVFSELDAPAKERLARDMVERMTQVVARYLQGQSSAEADVPSTEEDSQPPEGVTPTASAPPEGT